MTAGPRSKSSSRGLRRGFVEAPRAKAEGVELKEYTASDLLNGDGKGDGGDKPAEERSEPKMSVNVDIAKVKETNKGKRMGGGAIVSFPLRYVHPKSIR